MDEPDNILDLGGERARRNREAFEAAFRDRTNGRPRLVDADLTRKILSVLEQLPEPAK
jgi:hypothetical protein